ncbi:MAG: alpha/beta hydrolase [Anaerolineaceae bacterium]|nr:alpha/beta hydrolase [Anaerolineaceae bacterium]
MQILAIVAGVIIGLNLIGLAINKIFFSNELEAAEPYGQIVQVNGEKMHVYSMGSGEKTIVLLPGFGVALPSADFGPLMRELSKDYTVVSIEYFGIGFSEQTDTPRTNENITEEIRSALSLAGFKPPYILMPHSASGIYSEYYTASYPDEVSAIIMLDTTTTAKFDGPNIPKFVYGISVAQQECGLTRVSYGLMPPAQKIENGYKEEEINDYKLFAYHLLNNTMIDQSYRLLDNIKQANSMPFPQDIPVLKIISSQTLKKMGEGYQTDHLNRLGNQAKSMIMDGTHFIYQTKAMDISDAARAFLEKVQ